MNTNFHTESRMRENCTYGSMRGRAYPTRGVPLYATPSKARIAVPKDGSGLEDKMKDRFPLVSSNYAVVTIAEDSEFNGLEGIKKVENWRVRPGMGDAPFW